LSAHTAGDKFCPRGLMFGNPVLFLAFSADVINQTISSKEKNEPMDLFKIITDVVGGLMGMPVEDNQLKAPFS